MTPPNGENNPVDTRFISLFDCFNITFPSEQTIKDIYSTILSKYMDIKFSNLDWVRVFPEKLAAMTFQIYSTINKSLPRTPIKFHYIFNMREMSRVF